MLRREALPTYGRPLADALSAPGGDAAITLWPNRFAPDAQGEEVELSWPTLYAVLANRRPYRGSANHPGWAPATFAPLLRVPANVRSVSALVFCFSPDARTRLDDFCASWSGVHGFAYTLAGHTPRANAFAAIFPYRRPISNDAHRRVVIALSSEASRRGRPFDYLAMNAARLIPLTGAIPGEEFCTRQIPGVARVND